MPDKAYCKFCKKEMTAVITALKKHQATAFHKKQAQLLHGESSMSRIDSMWREQNDSTNSVKEAEIRLAAFLSEHNISFNVMDHLSDLSNCSFLSSVFTYLCANKQIQPCMQISLTKPQLL